MRLLPVVILVVAAGTVAGCAQRYYYNKPGATYEDFTADHASCLRSIGMPSAQRTHVYVSSDLYRHCMGEHGWTRAEKIEPAPPDWYRGQEKEEIVRIDAPPPPRPEPPRLGAGTSEARPRQDSSDLGGEPTYRSTNRSDPWKEHCRQIHLMRSDWKQRLPEYRACLAR
jgi:hypothetical protein